MKLTDWFPADVKPKRVGVYITRFVGDSDHGYSYWNGEYWGSEWGSIQKASLWDRYGHQDKDWKGLAEKPE